MIKATNLYLFDAILGIVITEHEIAIVDEFQPTHFFALPSLYHLKHEMCHINHTKLHSHFFFRAKNAIPLGWAVVLNNAENYMSNCVMRWQPWAWNTFSQLCIHRNEILCMNVINVSPNKCKYERRSKKQTQLCSPFCNGFTLFALILNAPFLLILTNI